jgi:hypothetical protein
VGSLLTFDIPQTALVATLDTYDFYSWKKSKPDSIFLKIPNAFFLSLAKVKRFEAT